MRPPAVRGCCRACYEALRKAIVRGEFTDGQLVQAGSFSPRAIVDNPAVVEARKRKRKSKAKA